jgi:hypothetical protein
MPCFPSGTGFTLSNKFGNITPETFPPIFPANKIYSSTHALMRGERKLMIAHQLCRNECRGNDNTALFSAPDNTISHLRQTKNSHIVYTLYTIHLSLAYPEYSALRESVLPLSHLHRSVTCNNKWLRKVWIN